MARSAAPTTRSAGRTSPSSTRREEILAVAADVFARKGIVGATVRDIADEAGILSGSLYHHFDSKDQMVVELLMPVLETQNQRYREVVERESDPVEVLRQLVHAGMRGVAEWPSAARILHNESVQFQTNEPLLVIHERRQDNRKLWVSVVRRGVRSGVLRKDLDADLVVRAIFDAVYSSTRWLPPRGKSTPERIADQLARLFLDGLRTTA